jgi:hypothetical protein
MSYQKVSNKRREQVHYERLMRLSRGNHEYAKRIAVGAKFHGTVGLVTDTEFMRGHQGLGQQFEGAEDQLQDILAAAKARGFKPQRTDKYIGALADDLGDPKAFVPAASSRHHVKRVAEINNLAVSGMVNHTPVMYDSPAQPVNQGD